MFHSNNNDTTIMQNIDLIWLCEIKVAKVFNNAGMLKRLRSDL